MKTRLKEINYKQSKRKLQINIYVKAGSIIISLILNKRCSSGYVAGKLSGQRSVLHGTSFGLCHVFNLTLVGSF
jgi:hypothetical protein